MIKKIIVILLMCIISFGIIGIAKDYEKAHKKQAAEHMENSILQDSNQEIVVWYNYEYYTEYLKKVAKEYYDQYGIKITLQLVGGGDMLESISMENKKNGEVPDIFITGSENLEKAFLLGLCSEVKADDIEGTYFNSTALRNASYKEKYYAYPLSYEVAVLVYNKEYVQDGPKSFAEIIEFADKFNSIGDEDLDEDQVDGDKVELEGKAEDAENDSSTEVETTEENIDYSDVENILVWDADSMFYDYGFMGKYISFSGNYSDGNIKVEVDKDKLKEALKYYKELHNYFALANEEEKYDEIVNNFAEGKIVYSILNMESIKELEESGIDYGISLLPDMTEELGTSFLSLTDVVITNPYGDNVEQSKAFAGFLAKEATYEMYEMIGILPAKELKDYGNQQISIVRRQYEISCNLPSTLVYSDYWLRVENLFKEINAVEETDDIDEMVDNFVSEIKLAVK